MIRRMMLDDLQRVMEIEKTCLPQHWQEKDFLYELNENPYSSIFVEMEEEVIRAFIGIWVIFERAEITTLAVDPCFQRKGIAQKLLNYALKFACEEDCEVAFLEVRKSNENARKLYLKNGFEEWRIKKDYYQNNHEDAIEMIRPLGGKYGTENFSD